MRDPTRQVLLADQHEVLRRGIRSLLDARPNIRIVSDVGDGRTALSEARASQPHIAIIDYYLPRMNGLALIRSLEIDVPGIQVLIYTSHNREDFAQMALRAGARGYVLKSATEERLLAAVDALSIKRMYFSDMLSNDAIDRALHRVDGRGTILTDREREVVQLVAIGQTNRQIADTLDLGTKTIESHRDAAMKKLELHRSADLIRYALRNGLVH